MRANIINFFRNNGITDNFLIGSYILQKKYNLEGYENKDVMLNIDIESLHNNNILIDLLKEVDVKDLIELYYELITENYDTSFLDNSIIDLIVSLLNISKEDVLLDLGSGNVQLFNQIIKSNDYGILKGIEINHMLSVNSKIILDLQKAANEIKNSDFLETDIPFFNKGYTFPPVLIKLSDYQSSNYKYNPSIGLNKKSSAEFLFINTLLNKMPDDGKVVAVVCGRPLFSLLDKEYRQYLLNNGLIEGVIQTPSNVLTNSATSLNVVVFSKSNLGVKFIDSSKFICPINKKSRINSIDNEKVFELYNSTNVDYRDNEYLIAKETLSLNSVLAEEHEIKNSKLLDDIADIILGSQYTIKHFEKLITNEETQYKILTSNDIVNGIVDVNNLVNVNVDSKYDKFTLKQYDIVMTSKSSKVKIAVIENIETNIIVTGSMFIIRPNLDLIDPYYLKMFLESSVGEKILKSIQKGEIINTISKQALINIKVSCPEISIQKKYIEKYLSNIIMYASLKKQAENLEIKIKNFYTEVVEVDS